MIQGIIYNKTNVTIVVRYTFPPLTWYCTLRFYSVHRNRYYSNAYIIIEPFTRPLYCKKGTPLNVFIVYSKQTCSAMLCEQGLIMGVNLFHAVFIIIFTIIKYWSVKTGDSF